MHITFQKTGRQIKAAITNRRIQLEERLKNRNEAIEKFINNTQKVRSYIVRRTQPDYGHGRNGYVLYGRDDISSEERQEIDQLCQRIHEIEQELHRLAYVNTHLDDAATFDLSFEDLIGYGFEAEK
jgi:cell division protein FtsB